jgi:hypothetical protein
MHLIVFANPLENDFATSVNGAVMTDAAIFCATWTLRAVLAASSLSALVVTLHGTL